MTKEPLNLAAIRARLAEARGQHYWRSLDELAATPEFQEFLHREFPRQASEWNDPSPMSRRSFLKLMGASLALAGLSGCSIRQPDEKVLPYVDKPVALTPGLPLFYATAMPHGGFATGLLARSNEGRPTKVEGNPDHPASLGATDVYAQASILGLYDPDRSQAVMNAGQPSTWENFVGALNSALGPLRGNGGAGLRILTETITSPTLASQMQALQQALPQAQWVAYEPAGDGARVGAQQAFGQDVQPVYRFDQSQVVLSFDANFLQTAPGRVRYAHDWSAGRLVRDGRTTMNRLYMVESTTTITGAAADHRLPVRASDVAAIAGAIAQGLGVAGAAGTPPASVPANWIAAVVADLKAAGSAALVIAGDGQPPAVHALAHAINGALGSVGNTVVYSAPVVASPPDQFAGLRQLAQDMVGGQVQALLILGGNPAYTAPADVDFASAIKSVPFSVHLSLYADETSALTTWHVPEAHFLESWSDARAYDGTAAIIQPLIAPLYGGKTAHELIAVLQGQEAKSYDLVRAYWQSQQGGGAAPASATAQPTGTPAPTPAAGAGAAVGFEVFWRTALNKGVIDGTAATSANVTTSAISAAPAAAAEDGLEITFHLDPTIWDGRFANNGWLQELPKPFTTLTWDNAALVSPATAERLGLTSGDVVELSYQGRTLTAPAWVQPGQPDESVAISLGYGRSRAGLAGNGIGANAYSLRTVGAPGFGTGLEMRKTGARYPLAHTQSHFSMEGHDLVHSAPLAEYLQNPGFAHESEGEGEAVGEGHPSLFPNYEYTGNKWGMVIDTSACIGCNACVTACQAENNIPVVGKDQVLNTREMHWLKIDQYYGGAELENPEMLFQPRMCQHCEKAPCEVVCPVAATVHDSEGLNAMIYNRCVGTRYCSNNCPYKVRRFNFLQYSKKDVPVLMLAANPEVTVRDRGVMEKCTYCVQRISAARIVAERENRPIADGEVRTACQQACPTNAIVFGNLNDTGSAVAKLKALEANPAYELLGELGTQPRTSYLPRVRNPNPELESRG